MAPEEIIIANPPQSPSNKKPILTTIFCCALITIIGLAVSGVFLYEKFSLKVPIVEGKVAGTSDNRMYFWVPKVAAETKSDVLSKQLIAKSAMVFNLDTDEVYFAKNPTKRLPMASITKAMTALLALERVKPTDVFTVSDYAAKVGENTMGVSAGEKYTVSELLWGIFLQSGNDAAEVIAENIAGSKQAFVDFMNRRAQELGMTDTHYTNPYGLEGDGKMYTTVKDLAIITKYTVTHFPNVFSYTQAIEHTIPATLDHKTIYLSSQIDLVRTYPGTIGYKTGFTDEAGYCIITVTENSGQRMVAIVLGSENRKADAVRMLDYAYSKAGIRVKHQAFW